jgi:hypothetical protein
LSELLAMLRRAQFILQAPTLIFLLCFSMVSHADACDQRTPENFKQFFSKFSSDKNFSTGRKIYPYPSQYLEYGIDPSGNDEPKPVPSRVTKEQDAHYPALADFMKENGLTSEITELRSRSAIVKVFKQDTDWLMEFYFRRKGNCWFMTEFQDHSL